MCKTSLDTGQMPEGAIESHITPIFIEGQGTEVYHKDYKPVALTNHVTKSLSES